MRYPCFIPPAALACQEEESLAVPAKRRRVTAEMEGKYVINMPKGTTPRTRKILEQQQAAKGTGPSGAHFPVGTMSLPLHHTGPIISYSG